MPSRYAMITLALLLMGGCATIDRVNVAWCEWVFADRPRQLQCIEDARSGKDTWQAGVGESINYMRHR